MNFIEEYKRKLVSPEEAVKVIKSGDTVFIPIDTEPYALCKALIKRRELEGVTIMLRQPRIDLGWLAADWDKRFKVVLDTQAGIGSRAINEKRADYVPFLTSLRFKHEQEPERKVRDVDVVMLVVSVPDEAGFCHFGLYLSHKRDYAKRAKKVLAEVSDEPNMMVRLPIDNQIHVSEIDFFVKHEPAPRRETEPEPEPGDVEKRIADYVSTLMYDGDTLQLGPGLVTSSLAPLGAFDGKHDLGIHSPIINQGFLDLVRRGIVNGRRKNINPGKSVSGGFRGITRKEDIAFIDGNPHFEVRDMSYINDISVIASHNNMVAINSVLAIDLTGQITADSLGPRILAGAGGQVDFVIGAMLSKGGRSISALHSTASGGKISRIVPTLENGTIVSIPRVFADYVVTEYGVATLWGKSQRERAAELISVAHPGFRSELRKEAERVC